MVSGEGDLLLTSSRTFRFTTSWEVRAGRALLASFLSPEGVSRDSLFWQGEIWICSVSIWMFRDLLKSNAELVPVSRYSWIAYQLNIGTLS